MSSTLVGGETIDAVAMYSAFSASEHVEHIRLTSLDNTGNLYSVPLDQALAIDDKESFTAVGGSDMLPGSASFPRVAGTIEGIAPAHNLSMQRTPLGIVMRGHYKPSMNFQLRWELPLSDTDSDPVDFASMAVSRSGISIVTAADFDTSASGIDHMYQQARAAWGQQHPAA